MRPMNTYDLEGQDTSIIVGKPLSANIQFKWPGDERNFGTTLKIETLRDGAMKLAALTLTLGLGIVSL